MHKIPFIKDKAVFKALSFCRSLIRGGDPVGLAIYKSSKYYDVSKSEVAHYMGKIGAAAVRRKKKCIG